MKRSVSFLLLLASSLGLWAQPLQTDASSWDFGTVFTGDTALHTFTLSNPGPEPITVSQVRVYDPLLQETFEVDSQGFVIAPGGTYALELRWLPRHNLRHRASVVVLSDAGPLLLDLRGQGRFALTYYQSTENLWDEALKNALRTRLAQGYQQLSYNFARDQMFMDIDNQRTNAQGASTNTLEGVYTGYTITGYSSRTNAQNQNFNTEHTFPQGFFNQALPMRSDLHHLFPTKVSANSERANSPFGVVTNPSWQDGGSRSNGQVFEPRDSHKGASARALLYFVLRYQDYSGFVAPQEALLRQWHASYPPTAVDRRRNEDVEAVQGNRNPLVDYPQLVERLPSITGLSSTPTAPELILPLSSLDFDTLLTTQADTLPLLLVNRGNANLSVSILSLPSSLSLAGGPIQETLSPGEGRQLQVILSQAPAGPLSLDLPIGLGGETVLVPVTAFVLPPASRPQGLVPSFSLYPNPAGSFLQLELPATGPWTLSLLDAQGRQLRQTSLQGRARLPLSELAPGTYYLVARQGGEVLTQTFQKR